MSGKIRSTHLARAAVIYVRQSSMTQVWENSESTSRQYALADRAKALGWQAEDVVIIDEDLGRSGATTDDRQGFAKLAQDVAQGEVGAILALEMSRLARSSADWQQLLRLCRITNVLVIDELTVYDPEQVDDRLLLDLKGTMSEAELNWLGLRLVGARRSKARRGELWFMPPTGYVWDGQSFVMDPDAAVRAAMQTVFDRFEVEPSAWAVVRWARRTGFEVPTRVYAAGGHSDIVWRSLSVSRLSSILHNPLYAGAYVYGRNSTRELMQAGEPRRVRVPVHDPASWQVCLFERHAGYITWERYLANLDKLRDNSSQFGAGVRGAPREGVALLAGIVVCGRCGRRMQPTYAQTPRYICTGDRATGGSTCWSLEATPVDSLVQELFLEAMVPEELELAIAVEQQASEQADALAAQWRLRIERAQYEARLAERRYMAVDPDNRVVARTLEAAWEERLRELERLRRDFERACREERVQLTEADRARIRAIASDLPSVWRAPTTQPQERQAMLRMVVEAVCLTPIDVPERQTQVSVQWTSGAVTEGLLARLGRGQPQRTPASVIERLRQLVGAGLHDEEVAEQLNAEGAWPAHDRRWTVEAARQARRRHQIERVAPDRPRGQALPHRFEDGRYSVKGLAEHMGVKPGVVRGWITRGLVAADKVVEPGGRSAWHIKADDEALTRLASAPSPVTPRKAPLPDQLPDGRWSIPGLARRFETGRSNVRGWIRRGIVSVEYEPHGAYPRAAWVRLDDEAERHLESLAQARRRRRNPSNDNPS
jgi:DNA invertase Pin-like site-specific DNA recombinase